MKMIDEMMNKKAELQIAPLIDVVFLLLIYFMVTAALKKPEADLGFILPTLSSNPSVAMPFEVLIVINEMGEVSINGAIFGAGGTLKDLITELKQDQQSAKSSKSDFVVSILPSDKTRHQRVIDVMDACAEAKVKNLSFSSNM